MGMVPTAKRGCQQPYWNTENGTAKGSRDGWGILQSRKSSRSHPTEVPRTVPPGTPPCWVSRPWLAHMFWGEQTLSTVTLMMPDAAYEPPLPSPHDKPFMVFICLLHICHSDFIEDTQAAMRYGPRSNPPAVCCTRFWTKRLQIHVLKPKVLAFIIDFF